MSKKTKYKICDCGEETSYEDENTRLCFSCNTVYTREPNGTFKSHQQREQLDLYETLVEGRSN